MKKFLLRNSDSDVWMSGTRLIATLGYKEFKELLDTNHYVEEEMSSEEVNEELNFILIEILGGIKGNCFALLEDELFTREKVIELTKETDQYADKILSYLLATTI